ncbi:nitrate/nitrite transporter NrtS [Aromatoleum bremense]|uniref:Phosphoenolpyruvate protein kinase n=1 Tax=Aromatoleum bremense TaxID=76115 RepID=A0ABX1NW24_9RHOO|nr:nitrate/nitrite transporter NrtS [Aromatoleum bremense]NMG16103.1 hypothetical protein [Aromatoleum bremense]QTQ30205.1 Uncharacterized protein pbN1_02130 [Aromatoleum bremense]
MTRAPALLRAACSPGIARAALKVSLVVGAMLNLVNQGPAIFAGERVDWLRSLLNFLVPYLVSSYSAALGTVRACRRNER